MTSEGDGLSHYKAYITILGKQGPGIPSGDDVLVGNEFKSKVLKDKGGGTRRAITSR